jgi:hypothetical protein
LPDDGNYKKVCKFVFLKRIKMAHQVIARTPELKGKEALLFLEKLYEKLTHIPTTEEQKVKEKELTKMKANYKALQSISNEPF